MTVIEPAFEGAGQSAGVEIWRIENFAPVPYSRGEYGKFYDGDSYIVLFTKEVNNILSWDIHFWLGKDSTKDERGTAAIKSVELDDMLGGLPIQHRETQEYESPVFLSYFKGGVRYLNGGVKSGFKHYDPEAENPPRLFQVKGKRNVRVREVEVSVKSMNKGDCFILDTMKQIYVYIGRYSKRTERFKAIQAANLLRDQDHQGRVSIKMIEPSSSPEDVQEYFTALGGGSRDDMAEAPEVDDDVKFEKEYDTTLSLYKVSDASGQLKVEKVGSKPLKQELLKTQEANGEDCFILDAGKSGIFVWIGKHCTREEKVQSMKVAESFLEKNNYPSWTRIIRVVEFGETPAFKQCFQVWKEKDESPPIIGRIYTMEKIAATSSFVAPRLVDASLDREKLRKLVKNMGTMVGFCPDDGAGQSEIFRVENFELAPVNPETHGKFFGGDSYVVKYAYTEKGREKYIVYFWQGSSSTQDEKAAAAIHAVKIDDSLHGKAVQVRVLQGFEPAHFLRIFKGRMVIYRGGHASGFKNIREIDNYDTNAPKLFQIQGTCAEDTRAIEVLAKTNSLDSDDVFLLDGPNSTYIWFGKGASEDEKAMAENTINLVCPDRVDSVIRINEGSEPDEFWDLLGGKGEYNKAVFKNETATLSGRLFHCSITPPSTKLEVNEVHNFSQNDLNEDDVMVLDTGSDEIFIWVGNGASPDEKLNSNKMADDYIKAAHERSGGNAVSISIVIKQNEEPESFQVLFPTWDTDLWK